MRGKAGNSVNVLPKLFGSGTWVVLLMASGTMGFPVVDMSRVKMPLTG